jgi:hypothetical protein
VHEVPAVIRDHFIALGVERGTQGPVGELVALLRKGVYDRDALESLLERHGVGREPWFRKQLLDLVLGYVREALDNAPLTNEDVLEIQSLKRFLDLREGEFVIHRPAEVSAILQGQLEAILEDGKIDSSEDLYQVRLQTLFDLSYDEYLTLARPAIERAWTALALEASGDGPPARRAARLQTLLGPLYGLTQLQQRNLGHLY